MPFIETGNLKVTECLPGWHGRYFHSANMTFAHYDFKRGAFIHEHFHPQEEVYEVIEGELELTIVPSNAPHSVKALTDGQACSGDLQTT
jgi:quercetin dioxygenase-like cupin family protein